MYHQAKLHTRNNHESKLHYSRPINNAAIRAVDNFQEYLSGMITWEKYPPLISVMCSKSCCEMSQFHWDSCKSPIRDPCTVLTKSWIIPEVGNVIIDARTNVRDLRLFPKCITIDGSVLFQVGRLGCIRTWVKVQEDRPRWSVKVFDGLISNVITGSLSCGFFSTFRNSIKSQLIRNSPDSENSCLRRDY